jgi:hypothetical protein
MLSMSLIDGLTTEDKKDEMVAVVAEPSRDAR